MTNSKNPNAMQLPPPPRLHTLHLQCYKDTGIKAEESQASFSLLSFRDQSPEQTFQSLSALTSNSQVPGPEVQNKQTNKQLCSTLVKI